MRDSLKDIDQLFSCVGGEKGLKTNNAFTVPELIQVFEHCYQPYPKGKEVDVLYDITEWLIPHENSLVG